MNNAELIQQLAALNLVLNSNDGEKSEKAKKLFTGVTVLRVGEELYRRISKEKELDQARALVVLRIVEYVKSHPKASENQLIDFVRSEFANFEKSIKNL